jgi:hypothetical protein
MSKTRGVGRPKFDPTPKLPNFEKALIEGFDVAQALEIADIPKSTYYRWLQDNPEYSDRVDKLKVSLDDAADRAIARLLNAKPEDPAHRKEIAEIAFRVRKEKREVTQPPLLPNGQPQTPQQIQINVGQMLTPEKANELTDDELARVRAGATIAQVMEEREAEKHPKKPSAS